MTHNITVESGTSVRLPTSGKYCDRDIVVTATVGKDTRLQDLLSNNLLSFEDDSLTTIKAYAFYQSTKLQTLRASKLTAIPVGFCNGASGLTTIDLPEATGRMGNSAFQNCTSLKNVNIPKITNFVNYAFSGCSSLEILDLSSNFVGFSGGASLTNCSSLKALILRKPDKIVTLGNVNNLNGSAIENGNGYVYTPRALVASYQSNTNWSNFSTQFRALEDYTVDGTITGALDLTKI